MRLCAPTVALRTIVQIDEQCLDVGKALFDRLPPIDQTIHQTIAENDGRHCIQKELIGGGLENAHGRHPSCWLEVVVGCFGGHATLASTCKRTNLDGCLGIYRNPQHIRSFICFLGELLHLGKDGIRFGEFFWG